MLIILFGAILLLLLIIFVAISVYGVVKQDEEWMKDKKWKEK